MIVEIRKQKKKLRQQLLDQRTAIDAVDFEERSDKIIKTLLDQQKLSTAHTVHCYVSMNERREVNTHGLIKKMLAIGKDVIVPVTHFDEGTLSHIRLHSFDALKKNKWGVLEPVGGEEVPPQKLDLVIVPMVGGDTQCNRIGYGKGFYDRFLKDVSCPKIGLVFEQNIIPEIPVEEFDISLDVIITEQRVIDRD